MKKTILISLIFLLSLIQLFAQKNKIDIVSNTLVCLMRDNKAVDSISIDNYVKGYKYIDIYKSKIYVFEAGMLSPDDFKGFFYIMSEYEVLENKFVLTHSLRMKKNSCKRRINFFKLQKKGILWKYEKGLFRKKGGLITFEEFYRFKEYELKCK